MCNGIEYLLYSFLLYSISHKKKLKTNIIFYKNLLKIGKSTFKSESFYYFISLFPY